MMSSHVNPMGNRDAHFRIPPNAQGITTATTLWGRGGSCLNPSVSWGGDIRVAELW